MADPVSLVGLISAVSGLAQTSIKLGQTLYAYHDKTRRARQEIFNIAKEVEFFGTVFEELNRGLQREKKDPVCNPDLYESVSVFIGRSRLIFDEIDIALHRVVKYIPSKDSTADSIIFNNVNQFIWPIKAKRIEVMQTELFSIRKNLQTYILVVGRARQDRQDDIQREIDLKEGEALQFEARAAALRVEASRIKIEKHVGRQVEPRNVQEPIISPVTRRNTYVRIQRIENDTNLRRPQEEEEAQDIPTHEAVQSPSLAANAPLNSPDIQHSSREAGIPFATLPEQHQLDDVSRRDNFAASANPLHVSDSLSHQQRPLQATVETDSSDGSDIHEPGQVIEIQQESSGNNAPLSQHVPNTHDVSSTETTMMGTVGVQASRDEALNEVVLPLEGPISVDHAPGRQDHFEQVPIIQKSSEQARIGHQSTQQAPDEQASDERVRGITASGVNLSQRALVSPSPPALEQTDLQPGNQQQPSAPAPQLGTANESETQPGNNEPIYNSIPLRSNQVLPQAGATDQQSPDVMEDTHEPAEGALVRIDTPPTVENSLERVDLNSNNFGIINKLGTKLEVRMDDVGHVDDYSHHKQRWTISKIGPEGTWLEAQADFCNSVDVKLEKNLMEQQSDKVIQKTAKTWQGLTPHQRSQVFNLIAHKDKHWKGVAGRWKYEIISTRPWWARKNRIKTIDVVLSNMPYRTASQISYEEGHKMEPYPIVEYPGRFNPQLESKTLGHYHFDYNVQGRPQLESFGIPGVRQKNNLLKRLRGEDTICKKCVQKFKEEPLRRLTEPIICTRCQFQYGDKIRAYARAHRDWLKTAEPWPNEAALWDRAPAGKPLQTQMPSFPRVPSEFLYPSIPPSLRLIAPREQHKIDSTKQWAEDLRRSKRRQPRVHPEGMNTRFALDDQLNTLRVVRQQANRDRDTYRETVFKDDKENDFAGMLSKYTKKVSARDRTSGILPDDLQSNSRRSSLGSYDQ